MKLTDAIINNPWESTREQLLHHLKKQVKKATAIVFWKHENNPVLPDTTKIFNEKLNYTHRNPVTAGFVTEPWHWLYSSAIDYFTDKRGLLELIIPDGF